MGQKNVTYTGIKFGNSFNKTYIIQYLHLKVDIIIILLTWFTDSINGVDFNKTELKFPKFQFATLKHLSRIMRKPDFCLCESKGSDQHS